MIELTAGELRSPGFNQALQKLATSEGLDFPTSYNISRILKKLGSEQTTLNELYGKLLKKWGESDDGGENYKIPEEKRAEFAKEAQEFLKMKVTIDRWKLDVSKLEKLSMSPSDFLVLEPLLANLEVLDGGSNGNKEESKKDEAKN